MKRSLQLILVAVVSCFVGSLAGPAFYESIAIAQQPLLPTTPRYQISAFGDASSSGCYIVDTTTGELWRSQPNRNLDLVIGPVREEKVNPK